MKKFLSTTILVATLLLTNGSAKALPVALEPYTFLDISDSAASVSGAVGVGHDIFAFEALMGDMITLDIDVTEILQGSVYSDDDSKLFLFNEQGDQLAFNDDFDGLQSRIENFLIPDAGLYFAGVATFGNLPLFDTDGIISGWEDDGMSRFGYELTVARIGADRAVPEPTSFLLMGIGLIGLIISRQK